MVKHICQLTGSLCKEEQFGLTNQTRMAAVSIPSNMAEGCGRNHFKDSTQFFFIARGSLYEAETQLTIACDLKCVSDAELENTTVLIKSCRRLLNGFINYFQKQADSSKLRTLNDGSVEYKAKVRYTNNRITINQFNNN